LGGAGKPWDAEGTGTTSDIRTIGFGVGIAFIAPGVVAMWGVSQVSPTVSEWFGATRESEATAAGFLFVVLASLSIGVFISGLRNETLIPVFRLFGLHRPENLDEGSTRDPEVRAALQQAVEDFFRYHQFYGNTALAILIAFGCWLYSIRQWPWEEPGILLLVVLSTFALALSAFQSLKRYFEVEEKVLGRGGGTGAQRST
jgi:hypothetical protein